MKVYRVHKRGVPKDGPWRAWDRSEELMIAISNKTFDKEFLSSHPIPHRDGIESYSYSHFCGTKTIKKIKEWFTYVENDIDILREALKKDDFVISEFEVDPMHVLEGNSQVMFLLIEAKWLRHVQW